jgi:excisionase family DNA binding protein
MQTSRNKSNRKAAHAATKVSSVTPAKKRLNQRKTVTFHGAPRQLQARLIEHELNHVDPKQPTKVERLYTVDNAAGLLDLSPWTLRHWMSQGKVHYERVGHGVRISASELLRLRTRIRLPEAS